jgi:hypothetical protein
MRKTIHPLAAVALPLSLACGAAFAGTGAGPSLEGPGEPVSCEIRVERQGNVVTLEGLVHADAPLAGSYRLQVSQGGSGGSSRISQGGDFEAAPGEPASLGTVSLASGGAYRASLEVRWQGGVTDCSTGTPGKRVEAPASANLAADLS